MLLFKLGSLAKKLSSNMALSRERNSFWRSIRRRAVVILEDSTDTLVRDT